MSATRIHSKISKVVCNPKNNPIFTHKVVAHPKFTPKNIYKVVNTYQISNTIPSQICPSHKDTYCPYHTNKLIKLSVPHAHYFYFCSAGTKSIRNSRSIQSNILFISAKLKFFLLINVWYVCGIIPNLSDIIFAVYPLSIIHFFNSFFS